MGTIEVLLGLVVYHKKQHKCFFDLSHDNLVTTMKELKSKLS